MEGSLWCRFMWTRTVNVQPSSFPLLLRRLHLLFFSSRTHPEEKNPKRKTKKKTSSKKKPLQKKKKKKIKKKSKEKGSYPQRQLIEKVPRTKFRPHKQNPLIKFLPMGKREEGGGSRKNKPLLVTQNSKKANFETRRALLSLPYCLVFFFVWKVTFLCVATWRTIVYLLLLCPDGHFLLWIL